MTYVFVPLVLWTSGQRLRFFLRKAFFYRLQFFFLHLRLFTRSNHRKKTLLCYLYQKKGSPFYFLMNSIKIALPKKPYTKAFSFFNISLKGSSNITGFKKGLYNQVKVQHYRLDPPYNRRKHRPSHFILNFGSISKLSKTFGYVNNNQLSFWIAHVLKGVYKLHRTLPILRETYRCEQRSTIAKTRLRVGETTSSHAEIICLARRNSIRKNDLFFSPTKKKTSFFNTFLPIFSMLQEAKIFVRRTEFFDTVLRRQRVLMYPRKKQGRPRPRERSEAGALREPSILGPFYAHTTTISGILISKTIPLLKNRYQNYVLALSIVAKVAGRKVVVYSSTRGYENAKKLGPEKKQAFFRPTEDEAIYQADLARQRIKGFNAFFSGRKKRLWSSAYKKARLFFLTTMAQKATFVPLQNWTPYNGVAWTPDVQTLPATCGDRVEAREEKKLCPANPASLRLPRGKVFFRTRRGTKHPTHPYAKNARTGSTWLNLVHLRGDAAVRPISRLVSLLDGEASYLLWRNMFSKSFMHSKQQLRHSSNTVALTSAFQHFTYLYMVKKKTLARVGRSFFSAPPKRDKGYVSYSLCARSKAHPRPRGSFFSSQSRVSRAYACFVKMNHSCFPALISRIKKQKWWLFSLSAHHGASRRLSVGYAFRNY